MSLKLYSVHIITYWVSCLLFMTLDLYLDVINSKMNMWKIAAEARSRHPPSAKKINSAIWISIANQILSLPLALWLSPYCVDESSSGPCSVVVKIVFYALVADQWFYWTHRILHYPWLYRNIHSIHHQWTYPMAIRAIYAHPIEHIVGNIGSFLVGPLIWPCGGALMGVWIGLATFNAVSGHSGIHFPLFSIEKHDLHHRILNCNYGTSGISDRMYGTRRF